MLRTLLARLGLLTVALTTVSSAQAADHSDPPAVAGDAATDIGDLFAWHAGPQGSETLTVVLTFGGPVPPVMGQQGAYDADTLYAIHFDRTGDNVANDTAYVRFAQNDLGDWGVQVVGLPGTTGPVVGAVETVLDTNGTKVHVGLHDDPFFFDLVGYANTLSTGTLSFTGADAFAGQNITAIVVEVPYAAVQQGEAGPVNVWATAARIGG